MFRKVKIGSPQILVVVLTILVLAHFAYTLHSNRQVNESLRFITDQVKTRTEVQAQQWRYENGFKSSYGIKPSCDGEGKCRQQHPTSTKMVSKSKDRSTLMAIIKNTTPIYYKDGSFRGLLVQSFEKDSGLAGTGLAPGDIIDQINGHKLTGPFTVESESDQGSSKIQSDEHKPKEIYLEIDQSIEGFELSDAASAIKRLQELRDGSGDHTDRE